MEESIRVELSGELVVTNSRGEEFRLRQYAYSLRAAVYSGRVEVQVRYRDHGVPRYIELRDGRLSFS